MAHDTAHGDAAPASATPPESTVAWLIRDTSASTVDEYMSKGGTWVDYRRAGTWSSPEDAARAMLEVDPGRFDRTELVRETRIRDAAVSAADVVPPPRQFGIVPASWLSEAGSWAPRPLLGTLRLVEARGIDPRSLDEVMAVYDEVVGYRGPGRR